MNLTSLQAQSLLLKTLPDRERSFVLEDLRTGHRCEFDSVVPLLDSLIRLLDPDLPEVEVRGARLKAMRSEASATAIFDSKGEHHESEQ